MATVATSSARPFRKAFARHTSGQLFRCEEPESENGITRVGLLVPSTTRGLKAASMMDLPIIKFFLTSFKDTKDSAQSLLKIEFHLYLGYDHGDPVYDSTSGASRLNDLKLLIFAANTGFNEHNTHLIQLKKDKLTGLWNQLFTQAYVDGMHYFYQVGDDVQFLTKGWAHRFVETLQRNSFRRNYGIVGPRDANAPQLWQEQSFVHRTHMQVFGYLFDTAFKDGSCDVWLAQAYGRRNSFLLNDVLVVNQVRNTRYKPHPGNGLVRNRVQNARLKACDFMQQCAAGHGADAYCSEVKADNIFGAFLERALNKQAVQSQEPAEFGARDPCAMVMRHFTVV